MKTKKLFLIVVVSMLGWSGLQAKEKKPFSLKDVAQNMKWKKIFSLRNPYVGATYVKTKDGAVFVFDKDTKSIKRHYKKTDDVLVYKFKSNEGFADMAAVNKDELWLLKNMSKWSKDRYGMPRVSKSQGVKKWDGRSWEQKGNHFYYGMGRLVYGQDGKMYLSRPTEILTWENSSWKPVVAAGVSSGIFGFDVNKNGLLWFFAAAAHKTAEGKILKPRLEFFVRDGKNIKSVGFLNIYETNAALLPKIGLVKMANETLYKWVGAVEEKLFSRFLKNKN